MKSILTVLSICIFLSGNVVAQVEEESSSPKSSSPRSEFKHALNICPIAPVFGIYAVNYEYLISPKNGVVARFEYEDVPKTYTDASIESSGMSYTLIYRRHLSAEMNSVFLGAHTRYRMFNGNGELESEKFDFTLNSLSIGLNAGKRWVWNSGFNIVFSLGYGIAIENRESIPSNYDIEAVLDQFEKEYDFMSPLFGELSIGYSF